MKQTDPSAQAQYSYFIMVRKNNGSFSLKKMSRCLPTFKAAIGAIPGIPALLNLYNKGRNDGVGK